MFNREDSGEMLQSFLLAYKIHKAVQEEHRKAVSPIPVFVDSMTPIQKRMADVCKQYSELFSCLCGFESRYMKAHFSNRLVPRCRSRLRNIHGA